MNSPAPACSFGRPIFLAGVVAGSIDICAAKLISGKTFGFICRVIASGVLGRASFSEGRPAAVLGIALQWAMTMIIAAIYVGVTGPLPWLRRNWIVGGLIAGTVSFYVMNYVVVPLSALHAHQHFTTAGFIENFGAILVFGLIIALIVRRCGPTRAA